MAAPDFDRLVYLYGLCGQNQPFTALSHSITFSHEAGYCWQHSRRGRPRSARISAGSSSPRYDCTHEARAEITAARCDLGLFQPAENIGALFAFSAS